MTKTNKIKAVKQVLTLVKNGATLTDARAVVANDYKVSSPTIANWQTSLGETVPTKEIKTDVVVSHRSKTTTGLNDLSTTLFDTIESLKQGRITYKEASAMSSLAGNITNIKKLQFAGLKFAGNTTSKGINKLLGQ